MRLPALLLATALAVAACGTPAPPVVAPPPRPPEPGLWMVAYIPEGSFAFVADRKLVMPAGQGSMLNHLSEDLLSHYEMILYIDKSEDLALSQTMTILERRDGFGPDDPARFDDRWQNQWVVTDVLAVSTGREEREPRAFTTTPVGIFNFDSRRFFREYESFLWDGAPMPNSMFVEWPGGRVSGIAVHGTQGIAAEFLGQRASGGCIRLQYEDSDRLFTRVTTGFAGQVPYLADRNGRMVGAAGRPRLHDGYRVLLVVDEGTDISVADLPRPSAAVVASAAARRFGPAPQPAPDTDTGDIAAGLR